MATIGDVLRYLLEAAGGLSQENQQEFTDAVNADYPPPAAEEPAAAEPAPAGQGSFAPADAEAEKAALLARLAELDAAEPHAGDG